MVDDESSARTAEPGAPPRFLAVFDALRARPPRRRYTLLARMERRVARRLPAEKHPNLQRGDVAEPPPVLDLAVRGTADRSELLRMLVERGGANLVWRLPEAEDPAEPLPSGGDGAGGDGAGGDTEAGGAVAAPRPGAEGTGAPPTAPSPGAEEAGRPDEDAPVTTDQLYDLLERLVDSRMARLGDQPGQKWYHKPPSPPRFARLSSLLWLRRCEPARVRANVSGSEVAQERVALGSDSKTLVEVINELRRVRLDSAGARRKRLLDEAGQRAPGTGDDGAPSRWERSRLSFVVRWRWLAAAASRAFRWAPRVAAVLSFRSSNEKVLTPVSFVVSLVVTATPFAVLGLAAQQVNELVGLLVGIALTASYAVIAFFVLLPWRPYRWLKRHRYVSPRRAATRPRSTTAYAGSTSSTSSTTATRGSDGSAPTPGRPASTGSPSTPSSTTSTTPTARPDAAGASAGSAPCSSWNRSASTRWPATSSSSSRTSGCAAASPTPS
ncbi:hypothetical protein HFP72_13335 [Nocardiopsis sp. ARC36]